MPPTTPSRAFDLVVHGATGFTGQLIAAYLSRRAPSLGVHWAISGRNAAKLDALAASPGIDVPPGGVLVADSADDAAMDRVASSARVVIAAAGPFCMHGTRLVEACVRQGTDYVDINGESPWVRSLLDAGLHEAAERRGVAVVPNCGFDSAPSDLGALFTAEAVRKEFDGARARRVRCAVHFDAKLSGGTYNTGIVLEKLGLKAREDDPFLLGGEHVLLGTTATATRADDADDPKHGWDDDFGAWTAPFMMAKINSRVVRRTTHLLHAWEADSPFSADFSYAERALFPGEDERAAKRAAMLLRRTPPAEAREAMMGKGRLPKPGAGPSEEVRAKSTFKCSFVGEAEDGRKLLASVAGGDPGYDETAKMVSESALLCLALREEPDPHTGMMTRGGGMLTPATAYGGALIRRLGEVGLPFVVEKTLS